MPAIPVLEVAIALALLYLFFSQVVTSVFELWAVAWNKRGRYLRHYLNQALNSGNDKNWAELVYRHPSVDMLVQTKSRPPAYVPSSVFVKAVVDLVVDEAREHNFVDSSAAEGPGAPPTGEYVYQAVDPAGTPLAKFEVGLAKIREGNFKALLRTLLLNAKGCTTCQSPVDDEKVFAEFIHGLAVWYDGYMERVSGWYKRSIRLGLFAVGLLVAVACNLDSLRVASHLWAHSADRQRIVAYAARQAADSASVRRLLHSSRPDTLGLLKAQQRYVRRVDSLTTSLQNLGFPIGWSFGKAAPSLDTLYQAVPAARPDKDGWQRQEYWLRYVRTKVAKPVPAPPRLRLADSTVQRLKLREVAASGRAGGAQLPRAAAAAAAPARVMGSAAAPAAGPALARPPAAPGPVPKPLPAAPGLPGRPARQTAPRPVRYEWVVDTLLVLRPGLATIPLRAEERQQLAAANPFGFPTATALLRPADRRPADLPSGLPWAVLGWLLTAAALSVGAPFWFEILNRFVNVRNLGMRPPSALPSSAKDPG